MSAAAKHLPSTGQQPEFLAALRALHSITEPLSEVAVRELLLQLARFPGELSAFEHFSPESYARNRVFSSRFVDLLLLCWRPGQRTPIHDHAGSTCGVYVMRGEAIEIGFSRPSQGPLIPSGSAVRAAGSLTVNRDDDIHLVANFAGPGQDLITLHCYSPPLASMRVFGEDETFFAGYSGVAGRALAATPTPHKGGAT